MPRLIDQPIQVTLVKDPHYDELRPSQFIWRRARFHVAEVLDRWEMAGRWWEQEPASTTWRVMTRDGGVYEVAKVHTEPPTWRLMAIYD